MSLRLPVEHLQGLPVRAQKSANRSPMESTQGLVTIGPKENPPGRKAQRLNVSKTLIRRLINPKTEIVKVFERQNPIDVHIVLDQSHSMHLSHEGVSKSETARSLACEIAQAGIGQHLHVSCRGFDTNIRWQIPTLTRKHLRGISSGSVLGVSAEKATSFANVFSLLAAELRNPSLVCIISDFMSAEDPQEWMSALSNLAVRHSILALVVRTPNEGILPTGLNWVRGIESADIQLVVGGPSPALRETDSSLRHLEEDAFAGVAYFETERSGEEHLTTLAQVCERCREKWHVRTRSRRRKR